MSASGLESWQARYNIAPSQQSACLIAQNPGAHPSLVLLSFGTALRAGKRVINARAETARTLPMFRRAAHHPRCAVLASGFYEWQPQDTGPKQPYLIRRQGSLVFAFAGLALADGAFVIVTTQATEQMAPIHARMPVMLNAHSTRTWLASSTAADDAFALTAPHHQPQLDITPIGRHINNPRNDDPSCVAPVDPQSFA
jgi:putative SOS response-associated peptidase YedK